MDIPADACHSPSGRGHFRYPPPLTEQQELFFIIRSHIESGRRKDSEISVLTERVMILQRLLLQHGIQVIPLDQWREGM